MIVAETPVALADADISRAARVLVHRHGPAAPHRADLRYRLLAAEQASAAPLWQAIRNYLADQYHDPFKWHELVRTAYPDAVKRLSGS